MVDAGPPTPSGTTVRHAEGERPGSGRWWGLRITAIAIAVAIAFALSSRGEYDPRRTVGAAHSGPVATGTVPRTVAKPDGLMFADRGAGQGWVPVGVGHDTVADRNVSTAVYAGDGRRMSASRVGGEPLGTSPGGRSVDGGVPVVVGCDADARQGVGVVHGSHTVVVPALDGTCPRRGASPVPRVTKWQSASLARLGRRSSDADTSRRPDG